MYSGHCVISISINIFMQDPEESLDLLLNTVQEREIDTAVVVYLLNSIVKTSKFSILSESSVQVRLMNVLSCLCCVIWALSKGDRNITYFSNGDDLLYII